MALTQVRGARRRDQGHQQEPQLLGQSGHGPHTGAGCAPQRPRPSTRASAPWAKWSWPSHRCGVRAAETKAINKSLSSLGKVVMALTQVGPHTGGPLQRAAPAAYGHHTTGMLLCLQGGGCAGFRGAGKRLRIFKLWRGKARARSDSWAAFLTLHARLAEQRAQGTARLLICSAGRQASA